MPGPIVKLRCYGEVSIDVSVCARPHHVRMNACSS